MRPPEDQSQGVRHDRTENTGNRSQLPVTPWFASRRRWRSARSLEVVIGIVAAVVEGQQGRVLEREHGKGRHQGIGQGDFNLARPRVRKTGETGAERPEKGVGGEVLPCFTGSKCHGESPHWPKR